MARLSSRSRGCRACIQRKVKCDEKVPECTQCTSRGRTCPGPTVGTIFVSMAPRPTPQAGAIGKGGSAMRNVRSLSKTDTRNDHSSRAGIVKKASSDGRVGVRRSGIQLHDALTTRVTPSPHPSGVEHGYDGASDMASLTSQFRLPPSPPSRAKSFDQLFLSHYIESFGNHGRKEPEPAFWFHKLPELLASPVPAAVKLSIRATGMIFYGVLTGNISIQTDACSWYAKAICSLRSLLENMATIGDGNAALVTDSVICAPVMMCQFEIMASTSPTAWMQHVEAAAAMLVSRGPEHCGKGLMHQIFLTVRVFVLLVCMTTNKQHAFTLEPWLTTPFEKRRKSPIDELVDILLSLPACLALGDKISNQDNQALSSTETRLHIHTLDIISRLDSWYQRYCVEIVELDGRRRMVLGPSTEERLDALDQMFDAPERRTYSNVPTAAFSAMYDAANLIAFSLQLLVLPATDQHKLRIQFHAQSIISAEAFFESNGSSAPDGGSLLMIFPLKVLGLWGPLPKQRDYAINKLLDWDQNAESNSISRFAAPVFLEDSTTVALSRVYHANVAAQVRLQQ